MTPSRATERHRCSIPDELKPADGRFGCGPSKVRPEALARLAGDGRGADGHLAPPEARQGARRRDPRRAARAVLRCPTATRSRSATAARPPSGTPPPSAWSSAARCTSTFGEFSAEVRHRHERARRSWTTRSIVAGRRPATRPTRRAPAPVGRRAGDDVIAWAHNETSTGVMVARAAARRRAGDALVLIDATSGAGGLPVDVVRGRRLLLRAAEGLRRRRRAVDRAAQPRRAGADRARSTRLRALDPGVPLAADGARELASRTRRTTRPRVATLFLLADQIRWMLDGGGLDWCVARTRAVLGAPLRLGASAPPTRRRSSPTPPSARSSWARSTSTSAVDAAAVAATLRANGIVDVEPYRKLGRNQLRIGMFPAVEPADVQALTACIDWVVERIAS